MLATGNNTNPHTQMRTQLEIHFNTNSPPRSALGSRSMAAFFLKAEPTRQPKRRVPAEIMLTDSAVRRGIPVPAHTEIL
jgi:hypothetical protein